MPNSEEILAANEKLRTEIAKFQADLTQISEKEKHTRWMAYILVGAIAALALFGLYEKAERADEKAQVTTSYQTDVCKTGNENRAGETKLHQELQELIAILLPEPPPVVENKINSMKKTAREIYAQRDCSAVREGKVSVVTPAP